MNDSGLSYRKPLHVVAQDGRELRPFRLARNMQLRELCIMPKMTGVPSQDHEEILHMQLFDGNETEGATDSLPVSLTIHTGFLERNGRSACHDSSARHRDVIDSTAAHLAAGLLSEGTTMQPGGYIAHYTVALLCERLSSLLPAEQAAPRLRFQDWQLTTLAEILSNNEDQDGSVESIAVRCGLSSCHFSRLFKATFGMPLHRYIVQGRIQRAQEQLAATNDAIAQIALDCGFADQSCFTRRFTHSTGMPPAVWRRQSRLREAASARSLDRMLLAPTLAM